MKIPFVERCGILILKLGANVVLTIYLYRRVWQREVEFAAAPPELAPPPLPLPPAASPGGLPVAGQGHLENPGSEFLWN